MSGGQPDPSGSLKPRWVTLSQAAEALSMNPSALRRTFERRAQLGADGVVEANIDGVRARKFAGRWRVLLGAGWSEELRWSGSGRAKSGRATTAAPKNAVGPERKPA